VPPTALKKKFALYLPYEIPRMRPLPFVTRILASASSDGRLRSLSDFLSQRSLLLPLVLSCKNLISDRLVKAPPSLGVNAFSGFLLLHDAYTVFVRKGVVLLPPPPRLDAAVDGRRKRPLLAPLAEHFCEPPRLTFDKQHSARRSPLCLKPNSSSAMRGCSTFSRWRGCRHEFWPLVCFSG